jgi:hypothetical protein
MSTALWPSRAADHPPDALVERNGSTISSGCQVAVTPFAAAASPAEPADALLEGHHPGTLRVPEVKRRLQRRLQRRGRRRGDRRHILQALETIR